MLGWNAKCKIEEDGWFVILLDCEGEHEYAKREGSIFGSIFGFYFTSDSSLNLYLDLNSSWRLSSGRMNADADAGVDAIVAEDSRSESKFILTVFCNSDSEIERE